jgi:hypothetical protein
MGKPKPKIPLPPGITYGKKYDRAMDIKTQEEADEYFELCVQHTMSFGKSREEAEQIEKTNFGYWAGYFSADTRQRIERLFRCEHPFFGSIDKNGPPSAERALKLGIAWGKQTKGVQ